MRIEELQKWQEVINAVTRGKLSPGQAREEMRRYLEKIGYRAEPGLELVAYIFLGTKGREGSVAK